ncbi:unnamed protein product, partial [Brenthis ino]
MEQIPQVNPQRVFDLILISIISPVTQKRQSKDVLNAKLSQETTKPVPAPVLFNKLLIAYISLQIHLLDLNFDIVAKTILKSSSNPIPSI